MKKIDRRKFIKNFIIGNVSIIAGYNLLTSCSEVFKGEIIGDPITEEEKKIIVNTLKYVPIQNNNPAIARWANECERCRKCVEACTTRQLVYGTYQATETKHVCIHCGTCLKRCEEHAITEKYNWQEVLAAIDNPSKVVIASISPAVRVGIGDYFGFETGSFLVSNLIGACRKLGFDYVLDTNFSADLTIMEEAAELQKRVADGSFLPQFTSCCPAWVKYVEIYYPSLLKHISTVKSPISMQGSIVKSYFATKKGLDPNNIVHVAITPCTAKKYEITRDELGVDGLKTTDYVITTNELAKMLKNRNVTIASQTGTFDNLMGKASGAGIIFGNTGGVTKAALRTAYYNLTGSNPPSNLIDLTQVNGMVGMKSADVIIGSTTLKVAVCYEMRNAKMLLDQVMSGTCKYHFIEVMACEGGCVGGAGQPAGSSTVLKRINSLSSADAQATTRFCYENPEIKLLYTDFLGQVGGTKAKKYLHTSYNNKSSLL